MISQNLPYLQASPPPPMASTLFELKLKITSAKDLKNVNSRHGSLKPSVSAWVEPTAKSSTKVDHDGDTSPSWNETLHIPVSSDIDDSALYLEILHDKSDGEDDTESVVGSASLSLCDVVDDVGFGGEAFRTLDLRPQGTVNVEVSVKDLQDSLYRASDQYYAGAARFARFEFRSPVEHSEHEYQKSTYGQVLGLGEIAGALDGLDPLEDSKAKKLNLTRASDRYYSDSETSSDSPSYGPIGAKVDEESDTERKLSNARVFALGKHIALDGGAIPDGSDLSRENRVKKLSNKVYDEEDEESDTERKLSNARVFALGKHIALDGGAIPDGSDLSRKNRVKKLSNKVYDEED